MDQDTRRVINKSQRQIKELKEITRRDVSKKFNIPLLLDELDGASFSGNSLTTSGTPTVDELEAAVGTLANRLNLIIRALKTEGIIR
jgi:arginase family enzyme